jgi:hypothetical protein
MPWPSALRISLKTLSRLRLKLRSLTHGARLRSATRSSVLDLRAFGKGALVAWTPGSVREWGLLTAPNQQGFLLFI